MECKENPHPTVALLVLGMLSQGAGYYNKFDFLLFITQHHVPTTDFAFNIPKFKITTYVSYGQS